MPYYYFDSTALVKRYSMERGTRVVNKLMVKRGKVAIVPMWSVTDFYSALSVRAQQGEITRDDCYSVLYKFEMEASQGLFQFIAPTMHTYLASKELILDYPALRSAQLSWRSRCTGSSRRRETRSSGMSATRHTPTSCSRGAGSGLAPCARRAASPASSRVTRASTMHLERATPRPRSRRHWAWRSRSRRDRIQSGASSPLSATGH